MVKEYPYRVPVFKMWISLNFYIKFVWLKSTHIGFPYSRCGLIKLLYKVGMVKESPYMVPVFKMWSH